MKNKITYLDCALTQKKYRDVLRTYNNQKHLHDPLEWVDSQEYYLSDGGYSRIVCHWDGDDPETIRLSLTSNSTNATKTAWERCKELISDAEEAIRTAVENSLPGRTQRP